MITCLGLQQVMTCSKLGEHSSHRLFQWVWFDCFNLKLATPSHEWEHVICSFFLFGPYYIIALILDRHGKKGAEGWEIACMCLPNVSGGEEIVASPWDFGEAQLSSCAEWWWRTVKTSTYPPFFLKRMFDTATENRSNLNGKTTWDFRNLPR